MNDLKTKLAGVSQAKFTLKNQFEEKKDLIIDTLKYCYSVRGNVLKFPTHTLPVLINLCLLADEEGKVKCSENVLTEIGPFIYSRITGKGNPFFNPFF